MPALMTTCDYGNHYVDPEDISFVDEENEACCYECEQRRNDDVLDDIFTDMEQRRIHEAALARWHPETWDTLDDVPF